MSEERLRVGVQLPEVEREVRWPEMLTLVQRAEAAGYDSLVTVAKELGLGSGG